MKQLRAFDQSRAGSKAGYCLQNVRLGFDIAPLYNDAWTAWKNTEQHTNRDIPTGVDVPLYYDYTDSAGNRYGHINVRLKDGRVWNDGKVYVSLATFERYHSNVHYVGWGESVNEIKVIEGEEMYQGKTAKEWYEVALKYDKRIKNYQLNYMLSADHKRVIDIKDAEIARLKNSGLVNEDITYIRSKVDAIWTKLTSIFK